MRLSIKTKQVLGVTSTVGAVVVALSLYYLAMLARVSLEESQARAQVLLRAIYQRAQMVVPRAPDQYAALREDGGLQAMLQASLYSRDVTDAAIVDPQGIIAAHLDPTRIGRPLPPRQAVAELLEFNALHQLWIIFTDPGRNLEVREAMTFGKGDFGTIRIGISTLLVREELYKALKPAITTVLLALLAASAVAMLLAQLFLRPIHVLKSGLTRLQQGERGITLDLPQDEFGDLGTFFSAVSEKLSADRSVLAGQKANLESVMDRLEDAIAVFSARGEMLFANPVMRGLVPDRPPEAWRELVQTSVATRQSHGPLPVQVSGNGADDRQAEWLLMAHPIEDEDHRLIGVMLMARNMVYLNQVQSTLRYSRKLTALGKLSAGVAHEVKNPLNAMMIHLELLRQKLSGGPRVGRAVQQAGEDGAAVATLVAPPTDAAGAVEHVNVIAAEIKRLDQVLQGFLKFARPEDLRLQPVRMGEMLGEVARVVEAEASKAGVHLEIDCGPDVPDISGDAAMLRQALLNLAINATQAMPAGGVLRFRARATGDQQVELTVEDTGVGIKPEHLQRIFDLYFTTREKGTGIGLSMVYRTVQLHDGEIEVHSTPGVGTAFRLLLPRARATGYLNLR